MRFGLVRAVVTVSFPSASRLNACSGHSQHNFVKLVLLLPAAMSIARPDTVAGAAGAALVEAVRHSVLPYKHKLLSYVVSGAEHYDGLCEFFQVRSLRNRL
eukprot:SAG11_NODE_8753_length_980_cov_0.869467_2_plen_101_part_00